MSSDTRTVFTDQDFALADRLDDMLGLSVVEDERRRELMKLVQWLAEADHTVDEVRHHMLGPYGALLRLRILTHRSRRALAHVAALNEELHAGFDEVLTLEGGYRIAEVLQDRLRLQLEVEAELVADLSPERRAVVDSVRLQNRTFRSDR